MEKQVVSIWAGTHGKLDDVDLQDVANFESQMHKYLEDNTKIMDTIRTTGDLSADTEKQLNNAIDAFRKTFITHDGQPLVGEQQKAAAPTKVSQEKIVRPNRSNSQKAAKSKNGANGKD
jgi:F-type H+-transporting ATPase subunit alpha